MAAALRALQATLVLAGLIPTALGQQAAEPTLLSPEEPRAGRPLAVTLGESPSRPHLEAALLAAGVEVARLEGASGYGCPEGVESFERTARRLAGTRPCLLVGYDLGAVTVINAAAARPDQRRPVLAVDPVCDLRSRPAGWGKAQPDAEEWAAVLEAWGWDLDAARIAPDNPIDRGLELASGGQPLALAFGEQDPLRPARENGARLGKRLFDLGGIHMLRPRPGQLALGQGGEGAGELVLWALAHAERAPDPLVRRSGALRTAARLAAGETVRVGFLGGSLTEAAGWRPLVTRTLTSRTDGKVLWKAAGRASFDSTGDAVRLVPDLLNEGPLDLVLLDCAVNDRANGRSEAEVVRGIEGVLFGLRRANPDCELALVHLADTPKLEAHAQARLPYELRAAERVAVRHGLPTIEVSRRVAFGIEVGELDWARDFGGLHPTARGYGIYARLIESALDRLLAGASEGGHPRGVGPVDRASYGSFEPLELATAQDLEGFVLDPAWAPAAPGVGVRQGFVGVPALVGTAPGQTLAVPFDGSQLAVVVAAGPDAGVLEWRVDGGPWSSRDLFTRWSRGLHLPWTLVLESALSPGEHRLELRVGEPRNVASTGHAVRIFRLAAGRGAGG